MRTNEEIDRIIAEWVWSKIPDSGVSVPDTGVVYPRYSTDLNAMMDAQKSIPKNMRAIYQHRLSQLTKEFTDPGCSLWDIIDCGAKQRAEAMVILIDGDLKLQPVGSIYCTFCGNYMPGHATGALDICTCI